MNLVGEDWAKIVKNIDVSIFEKKQILITGASGLIGGYLIHVLEYIRDILKINLVLHSVSKSGSFTYFPNYRTISHVGDLTDIHFLNSIPPMDYVVHAAGYGQPDKFQANPFTTILLNSFSLIYLLNKIGQQGRLLYCSSSEIYSGLSSRIFDERQIGTSSPQHPRAGYIESKRIGEAICSQFNSQKSERKRVISARIALAYGPGFKLSDSRVLNNFIDKALIEKRINLLDTGKSKRTYCYIGDTVEMCLKLLIYGNEDVYNVGGISSISIRKLAEMIGQITSVPVQYPETDENKKIGSPNHVKLDMTKTIKFCGKAEFTNLEQGLEKTIKWRKSYLAANYKI